MFAMTTSLLVYHQLNLGNCREDPHFMRLWLAYFRPLLHIVFTVMGFGILCVASLLLRFHTIRYDPFSHLVFNHRTTDIHASKTTSSWFSIMQEVTFYAIVACFILLMVYVAFSASRVHFIDKRRRRHKYGVTRRSALVASFHRREQGLDDPVRTILSQVGVPGDVVDCFAQHEVSTIADLRVVCRNPSIVRSFFPCVGDYCRFARLLPRALAQVGDIRGTAGRREMSRRSPGRESAVSCENARHLRALTRADFTARDDTRGSKRPPLSRSAPPEVSGSGASTCDDSQSVRSIGTGFPREDLSRGRETTSFFRDEELSHSGYETTSVARDEDASLSSTGHGEKYPT